MLSALTGDARFETAARRAVRAVAARRSKLDLAGGHINVVTGHWTHVDAGIGSYFDSCVLTLACVFVCRARAVKHAYTVSSALNWSQ